jgi:iron complex outermembrane recepter protein
MKEFAAKLVAGVAVAATGSASMAVMGETSTGGSTALMLEEVVVTAQKRVQVLTDVPISVTVVSGERLQDAGLQSVNQLPQMVPGLRIDLAGGFSQPTIRGVGSSIAGAGFTSNVATYVDGFYVASQLTTDMQLLSLENIQVLKGPQGTLFGRNATGGAMLLTNRKPTHDTTATLTGTYAKYDEMGVNFYGSMGLTDSIAMDVAGLYEEGDGFLDNIATGADDDGKFENKVVRSSIQYDFSENTSFILAYSYADRDDPAPVATGSFDGLSAGTGALFASQNPIVASDYYDVSNTSSTKFTTEAEGWFLTASFDLGWANLVSYTMTREEDSTSELDLDGASISIFDATFEVDGDTFSQEFNLSGSTDNGFDWILGAYYFELDEKYNPFTVASDAFAIPKTVVYDLGNDIESWALFGDVTYRIAERWYVTGGVRYSDESADAFYNVEPAGADLGVAPEQGRTDFDGSWDKVTPRAILRYEPNDDSSVYLSYTEGFKAGQLAPSSFTTEPVEPEEIEAYELGYKLASGGLRLDAAVYFYDYTDMQVASYDGVSANVTNAATSEIYGAELQVSKLVSDGLEVNLGVAYTHGEYQDYPNAPVFIQDPLDPIGRFPAQTTDASGFQMQRTPEWTGNLGGQYTTELARGTLILTGNYYYSSDFYFDPSEQFQQDSYGLLNARVQWNAPSEKWSVAVYGNNLTDEEYVNQVLPGQFAIQQTFGEPLVVGVAATVKY